VLPCPHAKTKTYILNERKREASAGIDWRSQRLTTG